MECSHVKREHQRYYSARGEPRPSRPGLRRHLGLMSRIIATPPRLPIASGGEAFSASASVHKVSCGLPTGHTFFFGAAFFLSGEALAALDGATRALRAAPVPRRALPARADRSTALPWPLASLHVVVIKKVQKASKCFMSFLFKASLTSNLQLALIMLHLCIIYEYT